MSWVIKCVCICRDTVANESYQRDEHCDASKGKTEMRIVDLVEGGGQLPVPKAGNHLMFWFIDTEGNCYSWADGYIYFEDPDTDGVAALLASINGKHRIKGSSTSMAVDSIQMLASSHLADIERYSMDCPCDACIQL